VEGAKTATAEIKARGQLTIPKKIREMSHMEEGSVVSIVPVGDSLVITPKKIELDEARRQLRKLLKSSGLTVEELVGGLANEREELFKATYGTKKKG
jgi:AbrB family looped-hinge helix DNA binding protein